MALCLSSVALLRVCRWPLSLWHTVSLPCRLWGFKKERISMAGSKAWTQDSTQHCCAFSDTLASFSSPRWHRVSLRVPRGLQVRHWGVWKEDPLNSCRCPGGNPRHFYKPLPWGLRAVLRGERRKEDPLPVYMCKGDYLRPSWISHSHWGISILINEHEVDHFSVASKIGSVFIQVWNLPVTVKMCRSPSHQQYPPSKQQSVRRQKILVVLTSAILPCD